MSQRLNQVEETINPGEFLSDVRPDETSSRACHHESGRNHIGHPSHNSDLVACDSLSLILFVQVK